MERNRNKPRKMYFGTVTLKSPFTQTTHTIIDATSRKLYALHISEEDSPRFDDKVTSFGAVRMCDNTINIGNCIKCTVDGKVC